MHDHSPKRRSPHQRAGFEPSRRSTGQQRRGHAAADRPRGARETVSIYKQPYAQLAYALQSALNLQFDSALPHIVTKSESEMHLMHAKLALTSPQPVRPHGAEQKLQAQSRIVS